MEKYLFREYDAAYQKFFNQEEGQLRQALGTPAHIEHVGSTAILGLGGKGVVDVLVGVDNLENAKNLLERAGYEFRETASTSQRFFFRRDYLDENSTRRVHLHVTHYGSQDWQEMLAFRDWLRKYPEEVASYAELKRIGIEKAKGDGETYRKHKEEYIQTITKRALHSLLDT